MLKNLYAIGEVAKLKDVTIKALRYYHEVGIIIPAYVDGETGYRYYTPEQFIHIDIVKYCRSVGVSIKELQVLFESRDMDKLLNFLQCKKLEMEQSIRQMEEVMTNIDELKLVVNEARGTSLQSEIQICELQERQIVFVNCEDVGENQELVYYAKLRKLLMTYEVHTLSYGMMYQSVGGTMVPQYVFAVVEQVKGVPTEFVAILPEGGYILLSYDKGSQAEQYEKLESYLNYHQIQFNQIIEIDLMVDFFNTQEYSCQIQILLQ